MAGVVLVGMAMSGCGATTTSVEAEPPPVVTASPDERVATFGLADRVAWPYWVHRVEVRVGDATVVDEQYGPDEARPRWLAHAKLPPGEHAVVVVAEVAFASTRLDDGDGCVVRLERHATVDLSDGHAAVDVGLRHRGGATTPFAERVALDLAPREGVLTSDLPLVDGPSAAICDDRAPLLEVSSPLRGSRSLWRSDQGSPFTDDGQSLW